MGSLLGHVLPGSFFLVFSLWWTWCMFHRYFLCLREAEEREQRGLGLKAKHRFFRYKNSFSFHVTFCHRRISFEGIVKIVAVLIGMSGEFVCGFENGRFHYLGNAQHMTMFFFFGINGLMDILQQCKIPMPPDLDYTSGILALGMEALLFFYHLHGRSPMDIQVHMLLFYVIVGLAVSTAFEMRYKNNVLPALCRVYFTMLQGSWFYQIGFILYSPSGDYWDENSHQQMMVVTLLFTWHNAVIFFLLLMAGISIYFRVKTLNQSTFYQKLPTFEPSNGCHHYVDSLESEQTKGIIIETDEEEV